MKTTDACLVKLLRRAQKASFAQKRRPEGRRRYDEKDRCLALAIRRHRHDLWIGPDEHSPGKLLIVGPSGHRGKGDERIIALHLPFVVVQNLGLREVIGDYSPPELRPA